MPPELRICLAEQRQRFMVCSIICANGLTQPIEGFEDPNYGGQRVREVVLEALPAGYRQTLITLDEATRELQDFYARLALPHILGYSSLAASAGAIPIPWVDC